MIQFDKQDLSSKTLISLYEAMLLPRMIEEKMLVLLRQGKISKWFSGIGQEAIAAGATMALQPDDFILPMHRNLGVFTARNIPLEKLFAQFQGKAGGFSKGRERSFHFGSVPHHIVGMISHLGPQLSVGAGIALGNKLSKQPGVTLAFTGEGGTSQGEFHEALNVASVWNLPVIFLVENNGYGLSTPADRQFKCENIADRGIGYGMASKTIDGNNILEVYTEIKTMAEDIRKNPHPVLLECMTFRMRGHEEASGTKYVPQALMNDWAQKDPLVNYEKWLLMEQLLNNEIIDATRYQFKKRIDKALDIAFAETAVAPDESRELADVYKSFDQKIAQPKKNKVNQLRMVDAIAEGMRSAMKKHDNLILMGQDIGQYGGVFKVTEHLETKFGKDRVMDTPLCESAVLGIALGLSVKGYKSMVEMQFADFVSCGFNQIVNNLAKIHYRWGQHADVVIRMPTGAGVGAGPFHSQSNEAWFFHTPGLKILYPSTPADAKGLLLAAFEDPNPVLFFEHKALYRSISADVPAGYYTTEIGKANLIREGDDLSIISYGSGVHWAIDTLNNHPEISADLLDLRSLAPLDREAIIASVTKTGKAIVLHEDTITGGIGAEISAIINEHCFQYLDGPVLRCGSIDTPVPFASQLEQDFLPKKRFEDQLLRLLNF